MKQNLESIIIFTTQRLNPIHNYTHCGSLCGAGLCICLNYMVGPCEGYETLQGISHQNNVRISKNYAKAFSDYFCNFMIRKGKGY